MIIYRDLASLGPPPVAGRAAVVGYFDGLHVGHRRLLGELERWAAEAGVEPAVVTFDRHPQEVLSASAPLRILSLEHRLLLLEREGIAVTLVLTFDRELASWPAEEFVARVLVAGLGARRLLMGFDSAFGHRRQGTYAALRERSPALGIEVRRAGIEEVRGVRVSSTLVREAIRAGDLARLEELLGRRFSLLGRVTAGDGRGRTLGFPTANLDVRGEALPPAGVYCARADRLGTGESWRAAVNIGRRPTFHEAGAMSVEAHLLGFSGDLLGEEIEVCFSRRLRDERKFASVDELKSQIERDVRECAAE